jgi:hypothetical protein
MLEGSFPYQNQYSEKFHNLNIHTSMKLLLQFVQKLPFFPLKRSIFFVQSKFQIIPEIDTISIIVEYYNINV